MKKEHKYGAGCVCTINKQTLRQNRTGCQQVLLYCNTAKSVSGRLMDVSQPKTVQKSCTDSVVGITHQHTSLFLIRQICRHSNGSLLTAVIASKNMTAVLWLGQLVTTVDAAWSQAGLCGTGYRQSYTGVGFPPRTLVFPCQHHPTNAPYSCMHQSPILS